MQNLRKCFVCGSGAMGSSKDGITCGEIVCAEGIVTKFLTLVDAENENINLKKKLEEINALISIITKNSKTLSSDDKQNLENILEIIERE